MFDAIGAVFNTILYEPLYNGFIFLVSITPFGDVGVAIIVFTILIRFLLMPVMHRSMKAQRKMKELEPDINEIKEETKEDKQEQSRRIMALYQEHGINPFSGCLLFLIQIPIIISLFWIFHTGVNGGNFDPDRLYAFISLPDTVNMMFLGFLDMSEKSLILALLAGGTQFFQFRLSQPPTPKAQESNEKPTLKEDFARTMKLQMQYGLPVFVVFIAYTVFSAAVPLYWTASNVFSIGHELLIKRRAQREQTEVNPS